MRISQNCLFDPPAMVDPEFLPAGVRPGRGWHPLWLGRSSGAECSLVFTRHAFPKPVSLAFDLVAFDTPKLLTVLCPGAPDIRVVLDRAAPQTVLAQSPIYEEGTDEAELRLILSCWPEDAPEGGTAGLGLRLLRLGPPAPLLVFPLVLADPAVHRACLSDGWSNPEPQGVWSEGKESRLALPRQLWRSGRALAFDLSVLPRPEDAPPLTVCIRSAGRVLVTATFPLPEDGPLICPVAGFWHMDQPLELTLECDTPLSPAELGINPDTRRLGIFLRSIDFLD